MRENNDFEREPLLRNLNVENLELEFQVIRSNCHTSMIVVPFVLVFVIILSLFSTMTLFTHNCHPFPCTDGIINCDNKTEKMMVGTICNLTCTTGYVSTYRSQAKCYWTGRWTNYLQCSTPAVLLVDKRISDIYYGDHQDHKNMSIAKFPLRVRGSVSGYIDESVWRCGGFDNHNRVTSSCYNMKRDNTWVESTMQMLDGRAMASSVVLNSTTWWIIGGYTQISLYSSATATTMIFRDSTWFWGPNMTSIRTGHCSCAINPYEVIVTGGLKVDSTVVRLVEKFSFQTMNWTQLPDLRWGRHDHACSQVWINDEGGISTGATNISTIIVAGGSHTDGLESSVEMFLHNKWKVLNQLPKIEDKYMQYPSGLLWMPNLGLRLIGGCFDSDVYPSVYFCTNQVWQLSYNSTYRWLEEDKSGLSMDEGNTATPIPNNYFH